MKCERLATEFVIAALAGCTAGVLVLAGRNAMFSGSGGILAAFGSICGGLFFWAVLCSALALRARSGLHAALLDLSLLVPTLMSYYFACHAFGMYTNRMILQFGVLLLLPSAGAAWLLRVFRDQAWFRPVLLTAGIGLLVFDLQNGCLRGPADLRLMLPLLVVFIYSVVSAPCQPNRSTVNSWDYPMKG